jgi:hypothetical protein
MYATLADYVSHVYKPFGFLSPKDILNYLASRSVDLGVNASLCILSDTKPIKLDLHLCNE